MFVAATIETKTLLEQQSRSNRAERLGLMVPVKFILFHSTSPVFEVVNEPSISTPIFEVEKEIYWSYESAYNRAL